MGHKTLGECLAFTVTLAFSAGDNYLTALADAQCVLLDSMTTLTFTHGLQKPVGASGLRVGAECNGKYANRSGKDNPYRHSHDPPQSKPPPWESSPSPGYISSTRS
jgi:hypothetical protein